MPVYKSFQERFDWLLGFLALTDPFTYTLLLLLKREEDENIGTMAVEVDGARMTLRYSLKFFEALSDEALRYVLRHEMFHLALHHCTGRKPTDKDDRYRHNVAADLAVNSLIPEDQFCAKPTGKYAPLLPEGFGLKPRLSLEQYFAMLPKQGGKGKGKGQGGQGQGKPSPGDQQGDQPGAGQPEEGHGGFDRHDGWSKEENVLAGEIIRQKVREMENSDRYWGKMPGDVKQMILAAQRSHTAWHRLLRPRLGQLTSKTYVHTIKRPNRRFGYPYTGVKRDSIDRILLLWDVSGSIHDHEKSIFLAETNRIAEIQPVDVLMFDDGLVGKVIPFSRKMKFIKAERGGGGTSFKEPFEYADRMRYGAVLCCTDGCAQAIPRPKHIRNILWAIVGRGKPPVPWGTVVNIDTVDGMLIPEDEVQAAA